MIRLTFPVTLLFAGSLLLVSCADEDAAADERERLAFIELQEAAAFPGFAFQGEYEGRTAFSTGGPLEPAGLQLALFGENRFRGMLYRGGLPGEDEPLEQFEVSGYHDPPLLWLEVADLPYTLRLIDDRITLLDESRNYLGHFEPVERRSPVAGLQPPGDARQLFSGDDDDLGQWEEGAVVENGLLLQGARTRSSYGDIRLHLEAKIGLMPYARSQRRTNSGIYIQDRYEVQILDSFALPVDLNSNGSLYNEVAPRLNMTYPPLRWQTYDVWFRAPRFDEEGMKRANARVTVYLNGVLVIDDAELESGTGRGGQLEEIAEAPIYLQDHTGPVRFRNVWLVEEEYSPPGVMQLVP